MFKQTKSCISRQKLLAMQISEVTTFPWLASLQEKHNRGGKEKTPTLDTEVNKQQKHAADLIKSPKMAMQWNRRRSGGGSAFVSLELEQRSMSSARISVARGKAIRKENTTQFI